MFESDDFDQVLSQFEFPEEVTKPKSPDYKSVSSKLNYDYKEQNTTLENFTDSKNGNPVIESHSKVQTTEEFITESTKNVKNTIVEMVTPKHIKRKMINSYFDHKSKRKFPGPAGLLTGALEENKDERICQMEILSQDIDFTQNNLRGDLFGSPLWTRLLDDLKVWDLKNVDSIRTIKQQAIAGSLRRRKAHTITAFVEAIDRSVTDPLIIMRDVTGNIKGTLHRDAWSAFSHYIVSEYCAFILWKPTILTTGAAFKKHYLNITLSNILAVYSSTVLLEVENKPLPDGYSIVYENDFTVIKAENNVHNIGVNTTLISEHNNDSNDFLNEELDSIFCDEIF